jgi:hypothetical protein
MMILLMYNQFYLVDLNSTYIVQIFQEAVHSYRSLIRQKTQLSVGDQAEDRSDIENATLKFHCFVEVNLIRT